METEIILSPLQLQQRQGQKDLTPVQKALKNGLTASQLVSEWSGTEAQLKCGYSLEDVAGLKTIPSIGDVSRAYGNMTAVQIIVEHLKSIFRYAGTDLPNEQLAETALSILTNYYYLNLGELCIFFTQLKAGSRGQVVWGNRINNQAIMVALYEFCRDRFTAIAHREDELRRLQGTKGFTRIENAAGAILQGIESVKKLKAEAKKNIEAFRTLFPSIPDGYSEKILFEAFSGKEDAIQTVFRKPIKADDASEALYRWLCDYNVRVNK